MADTQSKDYSAWLFYVLAFGWTWLFWGPLALAEQGIISLPENLPRFLAEGNLAAWGPLLASLLLTYLNRGWAGIKNLLRQGVRVRFGLFWYAIVLLLFPVMIGGAGWLAQLAGAVLPPSDAFAEPVSIPISFVLIFFLGGPLQEEFGWRGYATDRLQKKWNALVASLVIGFLWAAWHLPLFFIPREEAYYNRPMWGIFLTDMLVTVLLTWVYNNTNKSIFAAMLLHTTFNWSNFLFTGLFTDLGGQIFFGLLIAVVVVVVVVWGPRRLVRET
jgi:membrane protease YdiL (CAAX protease family)